MSVSLSDADVQPPSPSRFVAEKEDEMLAPTQKVRLILSKI